MSYAQRGFSRVTKLPMSGQASRASDRKNTDTVPKNRAASLANLRKGGGRPKGSTNKATAALKDMIMTALNEAHKDGAVAYLKDQAVKSPTAFLTLVGKVLPLQVAGDPDQPITHRIELVGIAPK